MITARVKIRLWLARADELPRIADVKIDRETARAYHVTAGHGAVESPINCAICGRDLTHPVSQQVGIGPVCAPRVGVDWSADTSPEAIAAFKQAIMRATTFEDRWLPKSQIEVLSIEGEIEETERAPAREEPEPQPEPVIEDWAKGDHVEIDLTDWIAEQKGLPSSHVAGMIEHATAKAILLAAHDTTEETWLPLSQVVALRVTTNVTDEEVAEYETDAEHRVEHLYAEPTAASRRADTARKAMYAKLVRTGNGSQPDPFDEPAGSRPDRRAHDDLPF
jgi:hypothetical protein